MAITEERRQGKSSEKWIEYMRLQKLACSYITPRPCLLWWTRNEPFSNMLVQQIPKDKTSPCCQARVASPVLCSCRPTWRAGQIGTGKNFNFNHILSNILKCGWKSYLLINTSSPWAVYYWENSVRQLSVLTKNCIFNSCLRAFSWIEVWNNKLLLVAKNELKSSVQWNTLDVENILSLTWTQNIKFDICSQRHFEDEGKIVIFFLQLINMINMFSLSLPGWKMHNSHWSVWDPPS